MYRTLYPVHREDEDFVVFRIPARNPTSRPSPKLRASRGDPAHSVLLSLALAGEGGR